MIFIRSTLDSRKLQRGPDGRTGIGGIGSDSALEMPIPRSQSRPVKAALGLACVLALACGGCRLPGDIEPIDGHVQFSLASDTDQIASGDTVDVRVILQSLRNSNTRLEFVEAFDCPFLVWAVAEPDLEATHPDLTRLIPTIEGECPPAERTITLEPGETRMISVQRFTKQLAQQLRETE